MSPFAYRGNSGRSALAVPPGRPAMRTREDQGEGIEPRRTYRGPLSGLRIPDLTSVLSGPFADDEELPASGGYFQSINRNKRNVEINLKTDGRRGVVLQLMKYTDGLTENRRVRAMNGFVPYERLRKINRKLRIRRLPCGLGCRGTQ